MHSIQLRSHLLRVEKRIYRTNPISSPEISSSKREIFANDYKNSLPIEYKDFIIYDQLGCTGRNTHLGLNVPSSKQKILDVKFDCEDIEISEHCDDNILGKKPFYNYLNICPRNRQSNKQKTKYCLTDSKIQTMSLKESKTSEMQEYHNKTITDQNYLIGDGDANYATTSDSNQMICLRKPAGGDGYPSNTMSKYTLTLQRRPSKRSSPPQSESSSMNYLPIKSARNSSNLYYDLQMGILSTLKL